MVLMSSRVRPSCTEDQQRINTFSKLNTRLKSIEDKIEGLKVSLTVTREGAHTERLHIDGSKRKKPLMI